MRSIYLDNNATTFLHPRVLEAMQRVERDGLANPASQHHAGRRARKLLEEAREGIIETLGGEVGTMRADRLIFTSGGTEANNLALFGMTTAAGKGSTVRRLIVSAIEHPSILRGAEQLQRQGWSVVQAPVNHHGQIDVDGFTRLLDEPAALAAVMLANHETGVLQPINAIAERCAAAGVPLHTDAIQAVGKIAVDFRRLNVASLSVAPHKFHGPLGIGALLTRHDTPLEPILFGGFQQAGLRPGSEPVHLAVGFHAALRLWRDEQAERAERMTALRNQLEEQLLAAEPRAVIAGAEAPRLPHVVNIAFPGINRQALVMALDVEGVACSTGSACASGSSEPSPVLRAMGLPDEVVEGSIRLSLSAFTTPAEIDEATRRILLCVKRLRQANSSGKSARTPS